MRAVRADETAGTVLGGVTLENVRDRLRDIGIRPGQRVVVRIVDPGRELLKIADKVSARVTQDGLTDEDIDRLLEE